MTPTTVCKLHMSPWFLSLIAAVVAVRQPPVITKFPEKDLIKPDEVKFKQPYGFSLPCEASGSNLTWTWKHNGTDITVFYGYPYSLSQYGTLIGHNLKAEHSGSYQCFVKDQVTEVQVFSRKLQVAVTVIGEFVDKTDVEQRVNLGQPFSFQCPKHKPSYGATYSWVGNQNIQFSRNMRRGISPDGSLYITYVTQDDINEISDAKGIKCKISGANSFRESGSMRLVKSDDQPADPGIPSWAIKPKAEELAIEGKSKTLYCFATGRPSPSIIWKKNGQLIVDGMDSFEIRSSFYGRRLDIDRISKAKHQDQYTCEAYIVGANGSRLIHTINLVVEVAPKWTVKPPAQRVDIVIETNGTLDCQVTASPPAKLTWYKNGEQLDATNEHLRIIDKKLELRDIGLMSGGMYQCVAENRHGMIASATWVHVRAWKPSFSDVPFGPFKLLHGSKGTLLCNPSAAPRPSFQWLRNGVPITSGKNSRYELLQNGSLVIKRVDKKLDEGNFTCRAQNFLGENSASAVVVVSVRPSFARKPTNQKVMEGGVVTFHCSASGYPIPSISWVKDGKSMSVGETLTFTVNRYHSGKYWCRVDNGLGFPIEAEAELDVQFSPSFTTKPTDQIVNEYERVTFKCVANGNPIPLTTWIKDGLTVGIGNNLTLTASRNDSGQYMCLVSNGLTAGIEESARLEVHYKPENTHLVVDAANTSAVPYGGQVTFTCTSHSHPVVKEYRFYRFQELLNQNTTGVLQLIMRESGLYYCIPFNDVGSGERAQIAIAVNGSPTAPSKLQLTELDCSEWTVKLLWVPGVSKGAPVDYYLIEEELSSDPVVFGIVFNVTDPHATQASFKVSGRPAPRLRMKAVNRFGARTSSSTVEGICSTTPPNAGVLQQENVTPMYSRAWFLTVIALAAYLVLFVVAFILIRMYRQGRGHRYNVKLHERKYGAVKNQGKEDKEPAQEDKELDDTNEGRKPFLENNNPGKGPSNDSSRPLSLCSMLEENLFGEDVSFADEYKETDVVFNYGKEGTFV